MPAFAAAGLQAVRPAGLPAARSAAGQAGSPASAFLSLPTLLQRVVKGDQMVLDPQEKLFILKVCPLLH